MYGQKNERNEVLQSNRLRKKTDKKDERQDAMFDVAEGWFRFQTQPNSASSHATFAVSCDHSRPDCSHWPDACSIGYPGMSTVFPSPSARLHSFKTVYHYVQCPKTTPQFAIIAAWHAPQTYPEWLPIRGGSTRDES